MSVLSDLLRHSAARATLRDPDATEEQRADARAALGILGRTYSRRDNTDTSRQSGSTPSAEAGR